jgi:protein-S-isoprenylcysteine O-methyltransferase Ste14
MIVIMTLTNRLLLHGILANVVIVAVMFVAAGTVRWGPAWVYLALVVIGTVLSFYGPLRLSDELRRERSAIKAPDVKPWDRALVGLLLGILMPAVLIVAGLDHRFGWTPPVPGWAMWAGTAGVVAGMVGMMWATASNPFFSAVVRIQRDRGHRVVTAGPYRVVRHPSYAGWILQSLSFPFFFGSLWTFVPAGLLAATLIVRTELEDRVLQRELEGYGDYAGRVKAKLVPGIW